MLRPRASSPFAAKTGVCVTCLTLAVSFTLLGAGKRPVRMPAYNPSNETVELFDGIESGKIKATLIPRDSLSGNVFLENTTDKPLNIQVPKAVAAVQVLKQGFGGGGGMGGMGGGGFFSVPAEKVIQVPMKSVCLQHGKAEPRPKMTYKLVKLDTYTKNPVLQELIEMFASSNVDQMTAQAATWHVTDNMSWAQLEAKQIRHVGGVPSEPYFSQSQLAGAQSLVSRAQHQARERKPAETESVSREKKI